MSKYGLDYYGAAFYGPTQITDYSAAPFLATPIDHRAIHLTWNSPTGSWTRLRLVRNGYGYAVDENDGTVLFDLNNGPSATGTVDAPVSDYLDSNLAPARLYYYTLFVYGLHAYNGRDDWRRAGNATGMSVRDYGYTDKLAGLLPSVYTTDLQQVLADSPDTTQLYRFLSLFGFQLDYTRSQYDSLQSVNDPTNVAGGLLPLMANQFGLSYEPEIGMAQLRVLLRNIVHIYKVKGTKPGIEALANALTGWGSSAPKGANLFLDYNDSSAEESVGRWIVTSGSGTLARYPADGTIPAFSTGSNKVAGLFKTTSAGAGVTIQIGSVNGNLTGIPINATQQYTVSTYMRAGTTARSISLFIAWYDQSGAFISGGGSSSANDVVGSWTRLSVTGTAPSNAAFGGASIVVPPAAINGEVHYFDAIQFESGSTASTFQEARDIRLTLQADRINEVANPSFETNTTGWTATGTTAVSRTFTQALYGTASRTDTAGTTSASATVTDTSIVAGDNGKPVSGAGIPAGSYVGTVTAGVSFLLSSSPTSQVNVNATATATVPIVLSQSASLKVVTDASSSQVYTTTSIVPGVLTYTFSAYVYGAAGNYQVQHVQSTPVAGSNVLSGPVTSVAANTWARISGTFTVPTNETQARWAIIGPASSTFYVDGVLVERGTVLGTYFDASISTTHPQDYLWEGTVHGSRSHYYQNLAIKTFRLNQLLPSYLWAGMTYTQLLAQAGT